MAKKEYKDKPGPIIDGPAAANQHHGPHVTGAIPEGQLYAVWRAINDTKDLPQRIEHTLVAVDWECISIGHVYRDAARVYAAFWHKQFNRDTRVVAYALDAWPVKGSIRRMDLLTDAEREEIAG